MMTWLLPLIALIGAWLMTGWLRDYAVKHALLDHPNDRSSHSIPTPRGGGLSIALMVVLGIVALALSGMLAPRFAAGLGAGSVIIALVGWVDDRRGLGAGFRALMHLLAAAIVVALAPISTIPGMVLAVLVIGWCTNLYNFMDGIDGLAGVEAVTTGVVGGAILLLAGQAGLASVSFIIAAASLGFLRWNWPPARIFMGDVGSGLLGFLFGSLAVLGQQTGAMPAYLWALLLGVFVVDATVTLLRRMLGGERWYAAHRTHAYQRMTQAAGWGHAGVTSSVLMLNLLLGALVFAAWRNPAWAPWLTLLGGVILMAAYILVELKAPFPPSSTRHDR